MKLHSMVIVSSTDYVEKVAALKLSGNAEFSNGKGITVKIVLSNEDIEDIEHMLRGKLKNLAGEM